MTHTKRAIGAIIATPTRIPHSLIKGDHTDHTVKIPKNNPRLTASHHIARGSLSQSANDHPRASSRMIHSLTTALSSRSFCTFDRSRSNERENGYCDTEPDKQCGEHLSSQRQNEPSSAYSSIPAPQPSLVSTGMLLLYTLKPLKPYRFCAGDHYAKGKSIRNDR